MRSLAIINAVIKSFAKRILAHRAASMVGNVINIRRKEALISLMHARGDVSPPKKSLDQRRAVIGAGLKFNDCPARMKAYAVHAFHAAHWVVIATPDRL